MSGCSHGSCSAAAAMLDHPSVRTRPALWRYNRGWRVFVTAPAAGVPVVVTIGDREVYGRSDRGGYIDVVAHDHGLEPGWRQVVVAAQGTDPVPADVYIVGDGGPGIVSDIDDTVICDDAAAANDRGVEHLRPQRQDAARRVRVVSDVPPTLAQVRHRPLSTGAWNTIPTLTRFLIESGYPLGPLLMTDWGATNTGWFRGGQEHKRRLCTASLATSRTSRGSSSATTGGTTANMRRVRRGAPDKVGPSASGRSRRPSRCCRTGRSRGGSTARLGQPEGPDPPGSGWARPVRLLEQAGMAGEPIAADEQPSRPPTP